jgi:hypothetical protein
MNRPQLLQHIHSFAVTSPKHASSTIEFHRDKHHEMIWRNMDVIKDVITQLTSTHVRSKKVAIERLVSVLTRATRLDGQVTVVLGLAVKIEHLELTGTLPVTHIAVSMRHKSWRAGLVKEPGEEDCMTEDKDEVRGVEQQSQDSDNGGEFTCGGVENDHEAEDHNEIDCPTEVNKSALEHNPFRFLKSLKVVHAKSSPVLPLLESLHLITFESFLVYTPLKFPYESWTAALNLQIREVTKINLDMPRFEKIITSVPHLRILKQLIVREVGWEAMATAGPDTISRS